MSLGAINDSRFGQFLSKACYRGKKATDQGYANWNTHKKLQCKQNKTTAYLKYYHAPVDRSEGITEYLNKCAVFLTSVCGFQNVAKE